jgi:hypothetical protein
MQTTSVSRDTALLLANGADTHTHNILLRHAVHCRLYDIVLSQLSRVDATFQNVSFNLVKDVNATIMSANGGYYVTYLKHRCDPSSDGSNVLLSTLLLCVRCAATSSRPVLKRHVFKNEKLVQFTGCNSETVMHDLESLFLLTAALQNIKRIPHLDEQSQSQAMLICIRLLDLEAFQSVTLYRNLCTRFYVLLSDS